MRRVDRMSAHDDVGAPRRTLLNMGAPAPCRGGKIAKKPPTLSLSSTTIAVPDMPMRGFSTVWTLTSQPNSGRCMYDNRYDGWPWETQTNTPGSGREKTTRIRMVLPDDHHSM